MLCHCQVVCLYSQLCSRTYYVQVRCVYVYVLMLWPVTLVCHYTADCQPGVHTKAFSVGHVNTRTQRKALSGFSSSCL